MASTVDRHKLFEEAVIMRVSSGRVREDSDALQHRSHIGDAHLRVIERNPDAVAAALEN
jgi:hypothetical protein